MGGTRKSTGLRSSVQPQRRGGRWRAQPWVCEPAGNRRGASQPLLPSIKSAPPGCRYRVNISAVSGRLLSQVTRTEVTQTPKGAASFCKEAGKGGSQKQLSTAWTSCPSSAHTASQRLPVPRIRWGKKGWPGQVCHLPPLPLTLPTSQGLPGKGGFSVSLGVFCSLACSMPVPFTWLAPSPPLRLPSGIHLLQEGLQNARLERCPSCHCAQRSALGWAGCSQ